MLIKYRRIAAGSPPYHHRPATPGRPSPRRPGNRRQTIAPPPWTPPTAPPAPAAALPPCISGAQKGQHPPACSISLQPSTTAGQTIRQQPSIRQQPTEPPGTQPGRRLIGVLTPVFTRFLSSDLISFANSITFDNTTPYESSVLITTSETISIANTSEKQKARSVIQD